MLISKRIASLIREAEQTGIKVIGPKEMDSPYGRVFYRIEGLGRTMWIGKPNFESLKKGLIILLSLGRRRV